MFIDGLVKHKLHPLRSWMFSASRMHQYMFNVRKHLLELKNTYLEAVNIKDFYNETLVIGRAEERSLRVILRLVSRKLSINTMKNSDCKRITDTVNNLGGA